MVARKNAAIPRYTAGKIPIKTSGIELLATANMSEGDRVQSTRIRIYVAIVQLHFVLHRPSLQYTFNGCDDFVGGSANNSNPIVH